MYYNLNKEKYRNKMKILFLTIGLMSLGESLPNVKSSEWRGMSHQANVGCCEKKGGKVCGIG